MGQPLKAMLTTKSKRNMFKETTTVTEMSRQNCPLDQKVALCI